MQVEGVELTILADSESVLFRDHHNVYVIVINDLLF